MTDRKKFEEMLELLVNEDREAAEALFHEIVVEKSRDIYETLLSEETDEEVDESDDDDLDESDDDDLDESDDDDLDESDDDELDESEDDDLDEMFGLDEIGVEDPEMGGDATDDMMGDIEMPDMGGEEGDEEGDEDGEADDAFADLEDALDALKAEFEKLMGDEEPGEEEPEMDMPGEEEPEEESYAFESDDDEEVEESEEEEVEESKVPKSAGETMREYANKISASMGDNGANTKSTVAKPNNMGGTSANIAKSSTEAGVEANKGNLKGSALSDQNPKAMNTKNVNVPGGKAAKAGKTEPGHGAEKKGKPETADNKKSVVGK